MTQLVQLSEVLAARRVVADKINRTPTLTSSSLGNELGIKLFFKAELFQKTGAFKIRGALNKIHHLTAEERARGVITISAGNHAQGVAYAAQLSGIKATVVMPQLAVRSKVDATKGYGAEVILHGEGKDLLPKMLEIQEERGLTFIPPFDDLHIIAGQGTSGLEILEDVPAPDYVIVPVGGGGSISGISAVIKATNPKTKVIGVEPTGADVMRRSLEINGPTKMDKMETIADGLAAPFTGEHTVAHVQAFVDEMVLVTDEEIIQALRLILERCKLLAEPSAAASFAAVLTGKVKLPAGSQVVCFLSGGNVDRERLKAIL